MAVPLHPHDAVDWVNASSTLFIAIFTFFMVLAVIRQTRASKDTSRAWVIATPMRSPKIGFIPEVGDPTGSDTRNIFAVSYKNTGETPAQLLESRVFYKQVKRLQDIPKVPKYCHKTSFDGLLLVKKDSIDEAAVLQPNDIVTKAEKLAVERQEIFWYAYGIVIYKDAFRRKHETRFGYVYFFPQGGDPRPVGFRREGLPPAYNKAT